MNRKPNICQGVTGVPVIRAIPIATAGAGVIIAVARDRSILFIAEYHMSWPKAMITPSTTE